MGKTQQNIGLALLIFGILGLVAVVLTSDVPFALSTGGARGLTFAEFDTPVLDASKFDIVDPAGDFGNPEPRQGSCNNVGQCLTLLPLPETVAELCDVEPKNGQLEVENCPISTSTFDQFSDVGRTITRTFIPNGGQIWPTAEGKRYQVILLNDQSGVAKDWYGQDLRIPLTVDNGRMIFVVGDFTTGTWTEFSIRESGIFEIIPNELDPTEVNVFHNDQILETLNINENEQFNVGFHSDGAVRIERINFEPQFSCKIRDGELRVTQEFTGGQEINIFDLEFNVVRFCEDSPAIILDESAQGSFPSVATLRELSNGETLFIPEQQRLILTYMMRNSDDEGNQLVDIFCDPDSEAYNLETESCKPSIGTLQLCDGQIVDGDCVSQITGDACQQQGGNLDANGLCIIRIPSEQVACEADTFNSQTGECKPNEANCEPGFKRVDIGVGEQRFKCIPEDSAIPDTFTDNVIIPAVEATEDLTGASQKDAITALLLALFAFISMAGFFIWFAGRRKN